MSVKVTVPLNNGINTSVTSQNTTRANVLSKNAAAKLDMLDDVVVDPTTTEDGYTLIFNGTTNVWEAGPATIDIGVINGGTY